MYLQFNGLRSVSFMPTYDYICIDCSHEFEEFQKMTDPVIKTCPKCGGKVKRKISGGAGLLFKGDGFYITDYKKNNGEKENTVKKVKEEKSEQENKPMKSDKS